MNRLISHHSAKFSSNCYSRNELQDYSLGRTDNLSAINIERHLSDCDVCEDTFTSLDSAEDTFVSDLKLVQSIGERNIPGRIETDRRDKDHRDDNDDGLAAALENAKHLIENASLADPDNTPTNKETGEHRIGDYRLIELVGRGGMGQVYRAEHVRLEKQFAFKILSDRRKLSREAVSRFQREMKIVGQLDHPSIVQATDAGQSEDIHYLAMEFVAGLDVSKLLRFQSPLRIPDACEIVRQAAEGIQYAHLQSVIHRDIKPSNLMVTEKGQIKILDLGLATLGSLNQSVDELTTIGQLMGTLDYMAPEQCDDMPTDHRCDIFSLGATLYKLLTGRSPHSTTGRQSPLQKIRAIAVEPMTPITEHRTDIPDPLVDIIHRCLGRAPDSRFQSASEFAEALLSFCGGNDLVGLSERTSQELSKEKLIADPHSGTQNSLFAEHELKPVGPEIQPAVNQSDSVLAKAKLSQNGVWSNWKKVLALVALIPFVVWGVQIIINWENGQLVIESDTGNIQVKLLKDGVFYKELSIAQGVNSTKVRAGRYEVLINDPSDQLVVKNNSFVLKRGSTTVASITSKSSDNSPDQSNVESTVAGANDNTGDKPNSTNVAGSPDKIGLTEPIEGRLTYKGKTLPEWLANPTDSEALKAAAALRRVAKPNELHSWIKLTVREKQHELSLEELDRLIRFMSQLCPNESAANDILDFVFMICSRYSEDEFLSGRTMFARPSSHRSANEKPNRRQLHNLVPTIAEQEKLVESRMTECLHGSNSSLIALSITWMQGNTTDYDEKTVDRLLDLGKHANPSMRKQLSQLFRLRLRQNNRAHEYLLGTLDSSDASGKLQILDHLSMVNPKMRGLAREITESIDEMIHPNYFESIQGSILRLVLADNPEIVPAIAHLLADKTWGWESSGSAKNLFGGGPSGGGTDEEPMKIPDNWVGMHGSKEFPSDRHEILATKVSRRSSLINSLGMLSNEKRGAALIPILFREVDIKFNDTYLNIVLESISRIDQNNQQFAENFWIEVWLTTKDQEDKRRALNALSSFRLKTNTSAYVFDSAFADLIFQAMRDVNCTRPNENELVLINEASELLIGPDSYFFVFANNTIGDASKKDLPFLLWTCYKMRRTENGQTQGHHFKTQGHQFEMYLDRSEDLEPLLVLRAYELAGQSLWPATERLLQDDIPVEIRQAIANTISINSRVASGSLRNSEMSLLKTGSANEMAPVLKLVQQAKRVSHSRLSNRDMSGISTPFAWMFSLLVEPRKELMENGTTYKVNLWEGPLLSDGKEIQNIHRLLAILENDRFNDAEFEGKKDSIIATLNKVIANTKDDSQLDTAQKVLRQVESSESIAAYLRASAIAYASVRFKKSAGVFPEKLNDLLMLPQGMDNKNWQGPHLGKLVSDKDPWGNEFKFQKDEIKNEINILSAGPDETFDTRDDVSSGDDQFRHLMGH